MDRGLASGRLNHPSLIFPSGRGNNPAARDIADAAIKHKFIGRMDKSEVSRIGKNTDCMAASFLAEAV